MLRVLPKMLAGGPLSILCLGAHSDDIEIGCGGTVLRLLAENPGSQVRWVVFSAVDRRRAEAEKSAALFLGDAASSAVILKDFEDGFFPYMGAELKRFFEDIKGESPPDVILSHYRNDLHQDHRLISELTWNTFRDQMILEYEIPKYDGDLGVPNFFVHLDAACCRRKVDYILQCFDSQRGKQWFSEDTFYAMLRVRGLESNAPGRYAEGFYCRKVAY